MDRMVSMVMWTIGMIRTMDIMGRCRTGETINSITSKGMKHAMGMEMLGRQTIRPAESMRFPGSTEAVAGRRMVVAGRTDKTS
jgi:hypothetical protein